MSPWDVVKRVLCWVFGHDDFPVWYPARRARGLDYCLRCGRVKWHCAEPSS